MAGRRKSKKIRFPMIANSLNRGRSWNPFVNDVLIPVFIDGFLILPDRVRPVEG